MGPLQRFTGFPDRAERLRERQRHVDHPSGVLAATDGWATFFDRLQERLTSA